jgi:hypothetical protein
MNAARTAQAAAAFHTTFFVTDSTMPPLAMALTGAGLRPTTTAQLLLIEKSIFPMMGFYGIFIEIAIDHGFCYNGF